MSVEQFEQHNVCVVRNVKCLSNAECLSNVKLLSNVCVVEQCEMLEQCVSVVEHRRCVCVAMSLFRPFFSF